MHQDRCEIVVNDDPQSNTTLFTEENKPRHIKSRNSQSSTSSRNANHILEDDVRFLCGTGCIDSLIPDGIDGPIYHPLIELDDLVHSIPLCKVNCYASNPLSNCQSLWDTVYHENTRCTTKLG